jgi:phospholipid transport system transporter-binding protein
VKKIKVGRVKHVSSTAPGPLPKQEVEEKVPEIAVSMSPAPQPANGRVVLPANCTIHGARALQSHLLEQLDLPGPCEIDGGGVQQVDTAGVQLVLAFALDCLERSLPYVWKSRSPALEEAIRVLNVGALLEYPG